MQLLSFYLGRFIEEGKVDFLDNGCWQWNKAKSAKGYAVVKINGCVKRVHRLVLSEKLDRPLLKGLLACHTCHNRSCINPSHLYEGTAQNNIDDMIKAGRMNRTRGKRDGESMSMVDFHQRNAFIKSMRLEGMSQKAIALKLDIHDSTVSRVLKTLRTPQMRVIDNKNKWNNKLTKDELDKIKQLFFLGLSRNKISKTLGRSGPTISRIIKSIQFI
jgi:DNA-binding CsgD family transcriptional regulator